MTTLILPCAGRSTRFSGMKPKWLLTYPSGELMIQKAVQYMPLDNYERIVFVIVKEHVDKYSAGLILSQAFSARGDQVQISVLEDFTSGPAETVARAIAEKGIEGPIIVKDSDNSVGFDEPHDKPNFVVGAKLDSLGEVSNVTGKSFLCVNEQSLIVDIVEKKVVSDIISLGVYGFADASQVKTAFEEISSDSRATGEIFLSHIISFLLHKHYSPYFYVQATSFEDWGTIEEWKGVQKRFRTLFCDIDGVIYKNRGKYGKHTWSDPPAVIQANVDVLKKFVSRGGQLILTTSRPQEFRPQMEFDMKQLGIQYYDIIFGINHSQRIIINDFAPSNPYPSCAAINIPRDGLLEAYLEF